MWPTFVYSMRMLKREGCVVRRY
uniref:Uncharacterized protein n=1 Tax=Anopheles christyi TaxID=43041 RepID=A0A182K8F2_9DIPT